MRLWLPELGFSALLLACVASLLLAVVTLFLPTHHRRPLLPVRRWIGAIFLLVALAFLLLLMLFIANDFSVLYVAQHGHHQLPNLLKIGALWGGHEGSLLLWLLCLAGWSAAFALSNRTNQELSATTLALLALMIAGFLIFILLYSDPFARLLPPALEGRDLNPMLQHIGLILHPPLLYLGYGGFAVCCALLLSALIKGEFSRQIAHQALRYASLAWCFVTAGIILGSWWAYSELGWGGWWFWDPVENASLLPWLTATALLHSLVVSQRTGGLMHWSLLLTVVTFILSLLGTLIVRSGILTSVHAFALDEQRAFPLLVLFTLFSSAALLIYALRAWRIQQSAPAAQLRQLAVLLLGSAVAVIVLFGTLYPMFYRLMGWGQISVGAPYFNLALLPFGLLALLLIVVSSWRSLPQWIAHSGVLLVASGILCSTLLQREVSVNIALGETVKLVDYQFTFRSINLLSQGNFITEQAVIEVTRQEQAVTQLLPERRFYTVRRQQMFEPGIAWSLLHDWYVVLGEKLGEDRYAMRFYLQTGIRWIWWGGGLMIIGVLAALWQRRKPCVS
ncbi:heme lyase NrfEFG subunit NrfE [Serratia microhaemolytica]|uniref:heme lyase NrfEFG subunit NrfE n=1 Tax=Serratia microhaemolytica TaxID=2675110 RepID=UPI001476AB30|nr:heme lyase NrfEFG subunit NrfE [Serratia microhaemolytica]